MRSIVKFFIVVVFFSFFIVACGGEEATLPDDEAKTDEVIDETPDQTDDNATDSETDKDIIESDPETDTDEEIPDEDSGEVTYHEPKSLDECQNSVCSEVCVLEWDQMGKNVILYRMDGDSIEKHSDCPVKIKLEIGSDNQCYTTWVATTGCNIPLGTSEQRKINSSMPISGLQTSGTDKIYYEFSETDEEIQENKVFNYKRWENCLNSSGVDLCEKYGIEKVQIEGEDFGLGYEERLLAISQ